MTTTATGRAPLRARLLLSLLAVAFAATACGGSDDSADSAAQAPATTVTSTTAAPPPEPVAESPSTTTEAPASTTTEAAAATTTEPAAALDEDEPAHRRIVSISPTATEMVFAIGAGDRVVAVDQFSYYPAEAPVTELDGWNPNVEAIASYNPDLVLMQTSGDVGASLEALGIEVWAHDAPFAFDDVYVQIEQLGAVTGQADEAAAVVAEMQAQIDELIAAAPDASGLSYYHELDNTLYTVTGSTFIGQVYGLFGLANVADPADADGSAWGYPQLSDEYLVDADPDIIFLADTLCCGQDAQTVAARPGWDQLTAVQTGRIVELNDDIVSRWGPRLVDFI
ncbi:MAG: ABC transporter substrate-binding protein, partial [Acidimicrobiaceae bacterium]|nr:ABC transporter substrate-binding protein [Acidimicrobiaceae bacterium]